MLLRQFRNYARCYGITLEHDRLDTPDDLSTILNELKGKTDETIRIFLYDGDSIKLTHERYSQEISWQLLYIPLENTWKKMNKTLGSITRSFVKMLSVCTGIETIDKSGYFEMIADQYNEPGYGDTDKDMLQIMSQFIEGSEACKRLEEFNHIHECFSSKQLLDYKPQDDTERQLIDTMTEGMEFLDERYSLAAHSTFYNKFVDNNDFENNTSCGYIAFDDFFRISYTNEMSCLMQEYIESDWNCGLAVDEFITIDEIKPEGDTLLDLRFDRLFPFLVKLTRAIDNFQ